jgi:hypothetical protein
MNNFHTAHGPYVDWEDEEGTQYQVNPNGFRTIDFSKVDMSKPTMLTLGDSHCFGISNDQIDIWPEKLSKKMQMQLINLGARGVSADYITRIITPAIENFLPKIIFLLWPDWTRFEYTDNGKVLQSLPTDKNRIKFMHYASDEWLINHFNENVQVVKTICKQKNIELIDITLYDLIQYIDHADRWPLAANGSHFNYEWHSWVSDIFYSKYEQKT